MPFSTVYGLKQNFNLINLSNQSLNISLSSDKTLKIGSDELAVDLGSHEFTATELEDVTQLKCDTNTIQQRINSTESPTGLRKRNVNWNVPIRSRLLANQQMVGETFGQPQVNKFDLKDAPLYEVTDEPQIVAPAEVRQLIDGAEEAIRREPAIDDDGFESLNGKSSSGEDNVVTSTLLLVDLEDSSKNVVNVLDTKQGSDVCPLPSDNSTVRLMNSRPIRTNFEISSVSVHPKPISAESKH